MTLKLIRNSPIKQHLAAALAASFVGTFAFAAIVAATPSAVYAEPSLETLEYPGEQAVQVTALSEEAQADTELMDARGQYTITAPPPPSLSNRFTVENPPAQTYSGAAVVAYASQFVGKVPYGSGNHPSTSFSCDGLTQYVFAAFGISLPRGVSAQVAMGVPVSKEDARAGDLVWWPGHLGIYDGNGTTIHSPVPGRYVSHQPLWGNPVYIRIVG